MGVFLFQKGEALLDGDEKRFEDAQAGDGAEEGQRNPEGGMHPERWREMDLDERGADGDKQTDSDQREEGRRIGRIVMFEHEVAFDTFIDDAEHVLE